MAATNAKPATAKTATKATAGHPVLLQFIVGFALILVAAWFADISDDTGNLTAGLFALLWVLWLMNNSSRLKGITPL